MSRRWPLGPALVGLACLAAGAVATLSLYAGAASALDTVLTERLAAVATTSVALSRGALDGAALAALAQANGLDEASVVTAALEVRADAKGGAGRRADLLRVDPARVRAALAGRPWAGPGYEVGALSVVVAYAPLGDSGWPSPSCQWSPRSSLLM